MRNHLGQPEIDAFIDGELSHHREEQLLAHASECEPCKRELEERTAFLDQVRSARPALKASADLRARVSSILETAVRPVESLNVGKARTPWRLPAPVFLQYAALLALIAGGIATVWLSLRPKPANMLVQAAIERHQGAVSGSLPVQLTTRSHAELTAWFDQKLPFDFRLPVDQDAAGMQARYQLVGGSVTSFRNKKAAYVAYKMRNELISLLVTTTDQAIASGGDIVQAKSLTFHTIQQGPLEVVSWSIHGLTYALVSNMTLPRGQSCGVCHTAPDKMILPRSDPVHRTI